MPWSRCCAWLVPQAYGEAIRIRSLLLFFFFFGPSILLVIAFFFISCESSLPLSSCFIPPSVPFSLPVLPHSLYTHSLPVEGMVKGVKFPKKQVWWMESEGAPQRGGWSVIARDLRKARNVYPATKCTWLSGRGGKTGWEVSSRRGKGKPLRSTDIWWWKCKKWPTPRKYKMLLVDYVAKESCLCPRQPR